MGVLPCAGNGKLNDKNVAEISVQELGNQRDDNNSDVLMRLREDSPAQEVVQVRVTCFVVVLLACACVEGLPR